MAINYSIAIMGTTPGTKKAQILETKAYGSAQCSDIIDLNEFAKHVKNHGSVYSRGNIKGVICDAVDCLRHLLLDGKRIKFGELGTFHVELKTEGAATAEEFSTDNIKAVNVRWTPGKDFQNLRQEASFKLVPTREAQANATKEIKNQETIHGME